MNITDEYIKRISVNDSAYKNGMALVKSKSFLKYYISKDGSVIFSECTGSAKTPYKVFVDFLDNDNPVFYCTCPSRQVPCKHAIGLIYAYSLKERFFTEETPLEILEKREKALLKKEKKETQKSSTPKPKKVNLSAEKKKAEMQLEGLNILEKLILNIINDGLGSIDKKKIDMIDAQSKQLGNYYLTGTQIMLGNLISAFMENDKELSYQKSTICITSIYVFIKKAREYINRKLSDPEMKKDTDTDIETLLGYAWQLNDLEASGSYLDDAKLIQLKFTSYDDPYLKEIVDKAYYINLNDGKVYKTYNYRPYKALKYIPEEDSIRSLILPKRMYIYPGYQNRRIRWESADYREVNSEDIDNLKALAKSSFAEVLKEVKNNFKNILSDKDNAVLLHYIKIVKVSDNYALKDDKGELILLDKKDVPLIISLSDSCDDGYMLADICKSEDNTLIYAKPLSVILDKKLVEICF